MPQPQESGGTNVGGSYEKMLKNVLKSMNAYGIVLSILATLSYSAFLQPPRPLDPSSSDTHTSTWQKLFFSFNGLSFFLSVCGLLFFASTSCSPMMVLDFEGSSNANEDDQVQLLATVLPMFVYINFFFGLSLACCVAAYAFAGFATVHHKTSEQIPIMLPCVIGGFLYLQAVGVSIQQAYKLWQSIQKQTKLWDAIKQRTTFGKLFTWYVDLYAKATTGDDHREPPQRNEDQHRRENQLTGSH